MEKIENIYEIVIKLCGRIEPTGDSNFDETRLENLEGVIDLVERLTQDIIFVARNKTSHENSVKAIGLRADSFISEMREVVGNHLVECYNCNELVEMIPTGTICPSCFCG